MKFVYLKMVSTCNGFGKGKKMSSEYGKNSVPNSVELTSRIKKYIYIPLISHLAVKK